MPSIPDYRRGRPVKVLGPWSYSPNDQAIARNPGGTRIAEEHVSLPEVGFPEHDSYLRHKVLKILNPPDEEEEDKMSVGKNGSRNKMDRLVRNSTQNPDDEKPRVLVRKVSKVSILSTARKVENNKIMTEQRLIPLQQQTLQKVDDRKDQKTKTLQSSQFASKVPREASLTIDKTKPKNETPGPGSYTPDIALDPSKANIRQNVQEQLSQKRVPFGSMNQRNAEFLSRDVACPFVDKTSVDNPAAGSYEPVRKQRLANVSSSVTVSNDSSFVSSSRKARVLKGSSLGRLHTLDEVDEDSQFRNLDAQRTSLLSYATRQPPQPGPGHYQLDLSDQIKQLTEKLAPRYKANPFGSANKDRFSYKKQKGSKQPLTEDQARVNELCRDLEEHTRAQSPSKDRPAPHKRIRKQPYKLLKEEQEA